LKIGAPADITIFDPAREWVVDSARFASKGKNTPFDGCRLKGKIMTTIVDGKVVYVDELLKGRLESLVCHSERSEESHRSGQAQRPKNLTQDKLREEGKSNYG